MFMQNAPGSHLPVLLLLAASMPVCLSGCMQTGSGAASKKEAGPIHAPGPATSTEPTASSACSGPGILSARSCPGDGLEPEEETLYNLINDYRRENGLHAIEYSPSLSLVANRHVRDLSENIGRLTHGWSNCAYDAGQQSTYHCMWEAPKRFNTSYPAYGFENAYAFSAGATALRALEGWKGSTPHNNVILNRAIWKDHPWKALGVGIYGNYAVIWFGKEKDSAAGK